LGAITMSKRSAWSKAAAVGAYIISDRSIIIIAVRMLTLAPDGVAGVDGHGGGIVSDVTKLRNELFALGLRPCAADTSVQIPSLHWT